jgi:neurotransmitter:Na+ symporter, NSS family
MPSRQDRPSVLSAIADAATFPRPVWGSERAYVLATIAGVVGLGNVWRFPYMAGLHGGGSFVLAYVVCVALMAIPLATVESVAGGLVRRSPVGTLRAAAGRWGGVLGWLVVGMTVAIMSYYLVVTGWTFGYLLDALRGNLTTFGEFTSGMASLWLMAAVGLFLLVVVSLGVKSIERASLYAVPILVGIVVALAVYAQTLAGAEQARAFFFGIDGDRLSDPATWRAAAGQAFYSLGIGQGVLIAYGSFVPAGTNLLRSTTAVALTNSAVSIISGLLVFAIVFTFDIPPAAGSELSFTAFPRVFGEMAGGAWVAMVFFGLLFLAGFTSCIGGTVVVMSAIRDEVGVGRAAAWTVGTIAALGVPSALSFTGVGLRVGGVPFLDWLDQLTGAGAIVVIGLLGAAVLARSLPRRRLVAASGVDPIRLGRFALGSGLVFGWAVLLPPLVVVAYVIAAIL